MAGIDYVASQKRLKLFADTIGVQAPELLECEDGAPAFELLDFCNRYGASLDWIFCGDVRAMIHNSYVLALVRGAA